MDGYKNQGKFSVGVNFKFMVKGQIRTSQVHWQKRVEQVRSPKRTMCKG